MVGKFYLTKIMKIFIINLLKTNLLKRIIGPENNGFLALLVNLVFGKIFELDQSLSHVFKVTGTLHILSASAYNVNVVLLSFKKIFDKFNKRKNRFCMLLVVLSLYGFLSDKSISIIRALISRLLYQLAYLNFRQFHFFRVLVLSLLLFLLADFSLCSSLSLQLTMTACLALQLKGQLSFGKNKESWQDELVFTPVVVQIFLAPLLLFYFQEFSLVSFLVNFGIFALIPVLTKAGLWYFFFKLGSFLWRDSSWIEFLFLSWLKPGLIFLVDLFIKILAFFERFSWLKFNLDQVKLWQLTVYYLAVVLIFRLIYQVKRQNYNSCVKFLFA